MKQKVLFLDRDGTIIVNKHYLNDPEGIEYLPGVFECLKKAQSLSYKFVIVTNQSGIPRGLVSEENLQKIHHTIERDFQKNGLSIEKIYHAPHLPKSNHPDRKPNPGMLLKAQKDLDIDFEKSWIIGDSQVDLEAGLNAGVRPIIITDSADHFETHGKPVVFAPSWEAITTHLNAPSDS